MILVAAGSKVWLFWFPSGETALQRSHGYGQGVE